MIRIAQLMMVVLATTAVSAVQAQGDAAAGQTKTAVCGACHGADGNSAAAIYPKLAGQGERYLLKQLHDIKDGVRNVPEMTGMLAGFNDDDLADIAAYFSSQSMQLAGADPDKEVQLNNSSMANALELGTRVYRAGNLKTGTPACSGCHSPTGNGNSLAGYPRLGGQHADYIAKQLRNFRAGARSNDGETMTMRQVAEHMSDAEIDAVANFISGLN